MLVARHLYSMTADRGASTVARGDGTTNDACPSPLRLSSRPADPRVVTGPGVPDGSLCAREIQIGICVPDAPATVLL